MARWRTDLTEPDRAALAPVIADLLVTPGYAADGKWADRAARPLEAVRARDAGAFSASSG